MSYGPRCSVIVGSGGGKRFHVLLSSRDASDMVADVFVLKDALIAKDPS